MRNFYHSCKFVQWPWISQKCDLGKSFYRHRLCSTPQKRFEYVLKTSWKRANMNSLIWWYVLKMPWRQLCKTSWRRLENLLKKPWRCLEDVFSRRWQIVVKMSGRRCENVSKTCWRRMTKMNILILIKTPWRHLEDIYWRRMNKGNMFALINTPWRRLEVVFWRRRWKRSSRLIHQDECLLIWFF